jgi:hypothetical protein
MSDGQKKLLSDAYQHLVDAGKLLSEPALMDLPKLTESADVVSNAAKTVGLLLA